MEYFLVPWKYSIFFLSTNTEGFSKLPQCYDIFNDVLSEINPFRALLLAKKKYTKIMEYFYGTNKYSTFFVYFLVKNQALDQDEFISLRTPVYKL